MSEQKSNFKNLLDESYQWPATYNFKFIVPTQKIEIVENLFPNVEITKRPSAKGNYMSLTINLLMNSSDEIIEIYYKVKKIEGVISL